MLPYGTWLLACAVPPSVGAEDVPRVALETFGDAPVEYVLERLGRHRVLLLGEAHWVRHDAELVAEVVSRLPEIGGATVAIEVLPASEQSRIDALTVAEAWSPEEAIAVLRTAAWPYRQYLEILHRAWSANRDVGQATPVRILALGPGPDWRESLPEGQTYEGFLAERVLGHLEADRRPLLAYVGTHHAFTRYHLPDLPERPGSPVRRFSDRAGNLLWRALGDEVFLVLLHKPWRCGSGEGWGPCLPLGGAIDRAAAALGRPVAFDVAPSPFADLPLSPTSWYGLGYPAPRFVDLADGYVWTRPVDEYEAVDLIPLAEFAPTAASREEVRRHPPFGDGLLDDRALAASWQREAERLEDLPAALGWVER